MNELWLPLAKAEEPEQCGGKAVALGKLIRAGYPVPAGACLTAAAYRQFVAQTSIKGDIVMELSRKPFKEMRWEEMWDAAQRIRHRFLKTPFPSALESALEKHIDDPFGECPVAVRSSAPAEDSGGFSFAGLHESLVNQVGKTDILRAIKRVWASLWSDAALLYRQEMNLRIDQSAMAVVIQHMVDGEKSGVVFTIHPDNAEIALLEAVHGINQGLVDGTIEPDFWEIDRNSGAVRSHREPQRHKKVITHGTSTKCVSVTPEEARSSPLSDTEIQRIFDLSQQLKQQAGCDQDIEWTIKGETLFVLQSRPITTITNNDTDEKRSWYLSLRRSFENLSALREKIEQELIPLMIQEADDLAEQDLSVMSRDQLAAEITRRVSIYRKWFDIYYADFIPYAHGARLFGQVYNDRVQPDDPYAFVSLLQGTDMMCLNRNNELLQLARKNATANSSDHEDKTSLLEIIHKYGGNLQGIEDAGSEMQPLLAQMALVNQTQEIQRHEAPEDAKEKYLAAFPDEQKAWAEQLLDLARSSWKLRDDDNIYLGRIEAQMRRAAELGERIMIETSSVMHEDQDDELATSLLTCEQEIKKRQRPRTEPQTQWITARQIVGQPASQGVATGFVRLVEGRSDLFSFKHGEILACDTVDPNMTFLVPLCAAIIERRGGMLIHSAIIAREYGIPCINGLHQLGGAIRTGDRVTVDGYLGILTIHKD